LANLHCMLNGIYYTKKGLKLELTITGFTLNNFGREFPVNVLLISRHAAYRALAQSLTHSLVAPFCNLVFTTHEQAVCVTPLCRILSRFTRSTRTAHRSHDRDVMQGALEALCFRLPNIIWLPSIGLIDHPPSCVLYNIISCSHVCIFVCMYLCQTTTLESLDVEVHICTFGMSRGNTVKFVYEGHRVKVKVTRAQNVEKPYSRNVPLWSAITPLV